jgi:Ca2+-binding EF-hand superfamily protein
MLLPAVILSLLASAAPEQPSTSSPIMVTGHVWAPFISPMGEPFRARSTADDTLARWFAQADRNHDGMLTPDEMQADADRFFALLDTDHDGEIGPDELVHYEWEIAPEIQVMSKTRRAPGEASANPKRSPGRWESESEDGATMERRGRRDRKSGGLQGAARYGLLNIPEPVAAADADFNRGISRNEFSEAAIARFQLLDTAHRGRLGLAQLQAVRAAALAAGGVKPEKDAVDRRLGSPLPPGN